MCVSLLPLWACCVCVCVCVCIISNQSTSKKPHNVSGLSKLDALLHKTHIKCRSILSLSKVIHQMQHDHPLSQRKWSTERTVRVRVGGDRGMGGRGWVAKNLKKKGRQYNMGLHKIGGWHPSACYLKRG